MDESPEAPTLIFIVGPPAVGKMTVGHELARRTGFKLFHNHHTIELVLNFFPYGSPPFRRLVTEFRRRVLEELVGSDVPGVIFTYVWAFDDPSDDANVERFATIFSSRGGRVVYVELEASEAERIRRNETEFRLTEKPSKRDVVQSRVRLFDFDRRYQLNSKGRFADRSDFLHIENTSLSADAAAERIIATFRLDRVASPA
jgi:hypothetical protein